MEVQEAPTQKPAQITSLVDLGLFGMLGKPRESIVLPDFSAKPVRLERSLYYVPENHLNEQSAKALAHAVHLRQSHGLHSALFLEGHTPQQAQAASHLHQLVCVGMEDRVLLDTFLYVGAARGWLGLIAKYAAQQTQNSECRAIIDSISDYIRRRSNLSDSAPIDPVKLDLFLSSEMVHIQRQFPEAGWADDKFRMARESELRSGKFEPTVDIVEAILKDISPRNLEHISQLDSGTRRYFGLPSRKVPINHSIDELKRTLKTGNVAAAYTQADTLLAQLGEIREQLMAYYVDSHFSTHATAQVGNAHAHSPFLSNLLSQRGFDIATVHFSE